MADKNRKHRQPVTSKGLIPITKDLETLKLEAANSPRPVSDILCMTEDGQHPLLCRVFALDAEGRCGRFHSCSACLDAWLERYYQCRRTDTRPLAACNGCKWQKPRTFSTICLDCCRLAPRLRDRTNKLPDRFEP